MCLTARWLNLTVIIVTAKVICLWLRMVTLSRLMLREFTIFTMSQEVKTEALMHTRN